MVAKSYTVVENIIFPIFGEVEEPAIYTNAHDTGAGFLGSTIKDRIAASKAKVTQVQSDVASSLDKLDAVTAQAAQTAKDIQSEADSLAADLGQFSNGSPAE